MPDKRSYSYIDSHGPEPEALRQGFRWLQNLAGGDPDKTAALIVVPLLANLSNIREDLTSLVGEANSEQLVEGKSITVGGVNISVMTTKKPVASWDGPVLFIFPSPALLDLVDALPNKTDMLVIPWQREEVQAWIDKHGASAL